MLKITKSPLSSGLCATFALSNFLFCKFANKPKGVHEVAIAELIDAKNKGVLILQWLKYKSREILAGPLQSSLKQE